MRRACGSYASCASAGLPRSCGSWCCSVGAHGAGRSGRDAGDAPRTVWDAGGSSLLCRAAQAAGFSSFLPWPRPPSGAAFFDCRRHHGEDVEVLQAMRRAGAARREVRVLAPRQGRRAVALGVPRPRVAEGAAGRARAAGRKVRGVRRRHRRDARRLLVDAAGRGGAPRRAAEERRDERPREPGGAVRALPCEGGCGAPQEGPRAAVTAHAGEGG